MSTPDPQTVREIAAKVANIALHDSVHVDQWISAVASSELGDCDVPTFVAYLTAIQRRLATATVSWPDEQQPADPMTAEQQQDEAAEEVRTFLAVLPPRIDIVADWTGNGVRGVLTAEALRAVLAERTALAARVAKLEGELLGLRGTELNPSPLVLDAESYGDLRDEIAATMTDDWDGDEAESWILVQYVRWLAAGQPRDKDGYPIRRETYPAADLAAEREARKADVRAVAEACADFGNDEGPRGIRQLYVRFADRMAALAGDETDGSGTCPCGCPVDGENACGCGDPCPCEPDCTFCLAPNPMRKA